MGKLKEKLYERSTKALTKISNSASEIEWAIKKEAEYLRNGEGNVQIKNEESKNRPESLDYNEPDRERLEEYYLYSGDKTTAYFAEPIRTLHEVEVPMIEYRKAIKEGNIAQIEEAFHNMVMIVTKEGNGGNVTTPEFHQAMEDTNYECMKKKSVQEAFKASDVTLSILQQITHEKNLLDVMRLQQQIDTIEEEKDTFKKAVKAAIKENEIYMGSPKVETLWENYKEIKNARESVYADYQNMKMGEAEVGFLCAILSDLKQFGEKAKAPDKASNSKEYDKLSASLEKLGSLDENSMPKTTTEKIELVKELRNAAKEYLDAKNAQFRPFPSGYRLARLQMANQILNHCNTTLEQLEDVLQIDKQMKVFKEEKIDRSYQNVDTFRNKLMNTDNEYQKQQVKKTTEQNKFYEETAEKSIM